MSAAAGSKGSLPLGCRLCAFQQLFINLSIPFISFKEPRPSREGSLSWAFG